MRILFIEPPYERFVGFRCEWYPMGLCSLAAAAAAVGHQVQVYHAEHSQAGTEYVSVVTYSHQFNRYRDALAQDDHPVWKEISARLVDFVPDIVALSVPTPKMPSALKIARLSKQLLPRAIVVAGGQHPTLCPESVLANKDVDISVVGEGEETLVELVAALGRPNADISTVKGIVFRGPGGKTVSTGRRELMADLDHLGFEGGREHLWGLESYTPGQLSMVMGSRGCPYRCGFCSSQNMWTRRVRYRSVDSVIREVEYLQQRFRASSITFMDDSFTVDKQRVKELCGRLRQLKPHLTWSCLTRADMVNDQLIREMKRSGCTKIDIGIESGNPRVLELIRKDIVLNDVRSAAAVLRRNRMFWSGFFMFGFPTETEAEVQDTLDFLYEVRPDWSNISIFTPYPGTPLFELAARQGMIPARLDYSAYSHQNISGRFTDAITAERFEACAEKMLAAVHRYNSSARSLFKRALTRGYAGNPALLLQDARKVFSWLKK